MEESAVNPSQKPPNDQIKPNKDTSNEDLLHGTIARNHNLVLVDDSEEANFTSLVLQISSEDSTLNNLSTTRSRSTESLTTKNALKSTNQPPIGEGQYFAKLQIKLAMEALKKKTSENEILIQENRKLLQLLQSTSPKKIWASPTNNTSNPNLTKMTDELTLLKQTILEYEILVQNKNKELQGQVEKSNSLKRDLKRSFSKKTEIQKVILEELEEKCRILEERLNVERKVREKREAEVVQLQGYLANKDKYQAKLMADQEVQLRRVQADFGQKMKILERKIREKDDEVSLANGNCDELLKNFDQGVEVGSPDKKTILKDIKIRKLEQSVQLKVKQLNVCYLEIDKLQEELKIKRNRMEKPAPSVTDGVLMNQLEDLRQKICEIMEGLAPDSENEPNVTKKIEETLNNDLPLTC